MRDVALRAVLGRVRSAGWWKPAAASYLIRSARSSATGEMPSDEASLRGAAAWLARAQDAAGDGGIAGRYRLASGWSSSYPETTGYAIPTLLTLADVLADDAYRERANRCVEFLLGVQLPSGAFPGLEIADNRTEPSPFNSAQILHGLHHWHEKTNDSRVLDAIIRAAHWIVQVQDDDGAWRQHFYRRLACTYSAQAACWLAEIADYAGEPRFRASAERNLRWVLSHRDPQTGWFDLCGFSSDDHQARRAHTHTIAYTLDGVLRMSECLHASEGREAVHVAAERLVERLERSRTLAGVLNHRWQPQAPYVCLTGNAQMASLWLRVARITGDVRFVNAAFKAIDEVKRAQTLDARSDGIRGGVPGSAPIGGEYMPFAFPNWAAKFFVDALCAKRACLAEGPGAPLHTVPIPIDRTGALAIAVSSGGFNTRGFETASRDPRTRRVVVYTTRISPKFARLAAAWLARGFAPALVVIETGSASRALQAASGVRHRADNSAGICRRHGWPFARVPSVNAPDAIAAIAAVDPLVAVSAGAGILRHQAIALPRLGTLNAHMGILPAYRGMHVAEWSALNRDPIGCSVFWVDEGIDTGAILATRRVDVDGCRSVADLRARVDDSQLALLDETLRAIVEDGIAPPPRTQRAEDGRQFFRMHADLRGLLETRLSQAPLRGFSGCVHSVID